jgi:hypothetical protein
VWFWLVASSEHFRLLLKVVVLNLISRLISTHYISTEIMHVLIDLVWVSILERATQFGHFCLVTLSMHC